MAPIDRRFVVSGFGPSGGGLRKSLSAPPRCSCRIAPTITSLLVLMLEFYLDQSDRSERARASRATRLPHRSFTSREKKKRELFQHGKVEMKIR